MIYLHSRIERYLLLAAASILVSALYGCAPPK